MRPLNPFAPEWTPTALRAQAGNEAKGDVDETLQEGPFDLGGLPPEVITSVVSFLSDPRDLVSCICACHALKVHVQQAELVLDIRTWRTSQGHRNGSKTEELLESTAKALLGLSKYMPGTVALLLPNLPLDDSDLEHFFARLPRLQVLDVSGARKVTHSGVTALVRGSSTHVRLPGSHFELGTDTRTERDVDTAAALIEPPSAARSTPPMPLRFVNLQRCFQLHSRTLDALFAVPGLRGLALSHLDLGRWPQQPASAAGHKSETAKLQTVTVTNSTLQVLALNNCLRLHGTAIDALAAACGGAGGLLDGGSGSSTPSSLRFLLLGGSTLALSTFISSSSPQPDLPPRLTGLLTSSYCPAVTTTAATTQAHLTAARHLLAAVLSLPRLVALELSFFPQPLVQCMRRVLADGEALGPRRQPVEVWDFAAADGSGDVEAVRRTLHRVLRVALRGPEGAREDGCGASTLPMASVSSRGGDALDALAVSTVLRCAVHCSSVTRSTPLHLAAERGSAGGVAQLLAAGAVVDARDTAGSTALFLASEAGHTGVVARLLAAGADPCLGNTAGETPLYIAALRGHLGCVQELLVYCKARGIAWQDPEMYGDAWTPLHAAAVANRADVAAYLLQAAGASGAGELVLAPNKYGQSVLHVAARKGSSQLLRLLLSVGGSALVGSRDGSGDTPVDVAKKNRHVAALAEFRRLTGAAGGGGHAAGRAQQTAATAMA